MHRCARISEIHHLLLFPAQTHTVKNLATYSAALKDIDFAAVKTAISTLLTDSQPAWPADSVITDLSSSAWHGTARGHTARQMVVEAATEVLYKYASISG